MVGGLQQFAFQQGREIRMIGQETPDLGCGSGTVMPPEEVRAPVLGEEDIAGPLDFGEFFKTRIDVLHGLGLMKRMVQVGKGRCRPRLDAGLSEL